MFIDTPIRRAVVKDMSDTELSTHVDAIRKARMQGVEQHRKTDELILKKKRERCSEQLLKQQAMLGKELDRMDKAIEKLAKRVVTVCALRLELEGQPDIAED